ncbi:MAG: DUF5658 family protein [Phycisphaerales bacterium]
MVHKIASAGRYPSAYRWFVVLAVLDATLTAIVLALGGQELNIAARAALDVGGVPAMVALKAVAVAIVLAICEYVGNRRPDLGLRLVHWAVAANTVPVTMGAMFISIFAATAMLGL